MNDDEFLNDFDELDSIDIESEGDEFTQIIPDENHQDEDNPDLIESLLRDRGITDINSINFEDEQGIQMTKSWYDLSSDEQRFILNQGVDYDPDTELNDEEIEFLNNLREKGLTPSQYVQMMQEQFSQNNNVEQSVEPTYYVDDISDEELFVLDLQAKSDEITEDEALEALKAAKQNESLWNKQISGIRNEYKALEENKRQEEQIQIEQQRQEEFNEFSNNIVNSIQNMNSFGELDINLENEDKEELAEFLLGKDSAGVNHFSKAINDPDTLVQMAWFALHGEDTFNEINRYMAEQIKHVQQQAYEKGLNDGRNSQSRVSFSQQKSNKNQGDTLDDLF